MTTKYLNLPALALTFIFGLSTTVFGVGADFNDDGLHNVADLDSLVAAIANGTTEISLYDLTDDELVDKADISEWLSIGGNINLGVTYLEADANLDGTVNETDLEGWLENRFTETTFWSAGDFNADGTVDGFDFLMWNANKFETVLTGSLSTVPEPSGMLLILPAIMLLFRRKN